MDFDAFEELPLRASDSQALDWDEVKEERLWDVPEQWWATWGRAEVIYRVTIELPREELTTQVWDQLSQHHDVDDHTLMCGGAYIERTDELTLSVVSSGEDGLDSLDYTVNDVLLATIEEIEPDTDWAVVQEERLEDK